MHCPSSPRRDPLSCLRNNLARSAFHGLPTMCLLLVAKGRILPHLLLCQNNQRLIPQQTRPRCHPVLCSRSEFPPQMTCQLPSPSPCSPPFPAPLVSSHLASTPSQEH